MEPDFLRYQCQIALPGFSEAAQWRLQAAKVLIAGAGGLGCPAGQYLAAAGIGVLGIADFDTISVSNLHRQILYTPDEAGQKKAPIAARKLQAQNRGIRVIAHDVRIHAGNVIDLLAPYDLVVDATDNLETRYLLNDACVLTGKPLVYGAIYQYEGQVAVWNAMQENGTRSPHYRDLFPEADPAQIPDCATGGVLPTLAGIIGCMQANEAIKWITGTGDLLAGKLLLFDARTMQGRIIKTGTVSRVAILQLPETEEVPVISVADLAKTVDDYELIDVRSEAERQAFHIGGWHVPLAQLADELALSGKPVVCYCASGKRSAAAVRIIRERFPGLQVFSLAGGMDAWRKEL